jgi:hypothetical protein
MSRRMLLCLGFLLPGCVMLHRASRPAHAPPEEAGKMTFPFILPEAGEVHLDGNSVASIQLAMDHFLPRGFQPSPEQLYFQDACEFERESYDVLAVPEPEGVMLVRFTLNQDVCKVTKGSADAATGQPVVDMRTYAVDVRTWRILSMDVAPMPPPKPSPHESGSP